MKAPDKIYLHPDIGGHEFIRPWLQRPANSESIAYIREDVVCEWIKRTWSETDDRFKQDYTGMLIKNFKNYLKGE